MNQNRKIRWGLKVNMIINISVFIILVLIPLSFKVSNNTINLNTSNVFADEYQDQLQKLKDANEKARQIANELGTYLKNHKPTLGNFSSYEYRRIEARAQDIIIEINTISGNLNLMTLTEDQRAEVVRVSDEGKKLIIDALSNPVDVSAQKKAEVKTKYTLLAPIAKLTCIDMNGKDPNCVNGLGGYLNVLVKIIIGLCGVTAVVMLVINFIGYMSSESFTEKAHFKQKFWGPIGGLLLALGAYAILMTINPALTGKDGLTIDQVGVEVFDDTPEGGDLSEPIYISVGGGGGGTPPTNPGVTCASGSVTQGFCMIGDYNSPKPTGEIPALVKLLETDKSYKITKIHIIHNGTNEKFIFFVSNGSTERQFTTMGIGHGPGIAPNKDWKFALGKGFSGDMRTPTGTFSIINKDKAKNQNTVLASTRINKKTGVGYSMGGAKFNLDYRGIAIHSNRKNSLGSSAGCILMYNDDLFALYPHIRTNGSVKVTIIGSSTIATNTDMGANTTPTSSSSSTQKLCTDVASCQKLCTDTNNGNNYTGNPPGLLNPSSAVALTGIPLVEARCKDCGGVTPKGSPQVVAVLKKIEPAVKELIKNKEIPDRKYNFRVYSAYRSAKDQIRVMCINPSTGGTNTVKANELGSLYAYPATSNHGTGTAIDFKFYFNNTEVFNYGSTRAEGSIEKILDKAGLYRLNSESWHFQTNSSSKTCKYPNCGEPKYKVDTTLEV